MSKMTETSILQTQKDIKSSAIITQIFGHQRAENEARNVLRQFQATGYADLAPF